MHSLCGVLIMTILVPIDELPITKMLNQLVQAYNLTPHDKNTARSQALKRIAEQTPPIAWMRENLRPHLDYYGVKNHPRTNQQAFKNVYREKNSDEPGDLNGNPSLKP